MFVGRLFNEGLAAKGGKRWAEKTPLTITMADKLHQLFPDLYYFHIIREPKDIYCSMLRQNWGFKNVESFVKHYNAVMLKARVAMKKIPHSQYHVVSIESLTINPNTIFRGLLDITGLPYTEELLPKLTFQVTPMSANKDRWKDELSIEEGMQIDEGCNKTYEFWSSLEKIAVVQ